MKTQLMWSTPRYQEGLGYITEAHVTGGFYRAVELIGHSSWFWSGDFAEGGGCFTHQTQELGYAMMACNEHWQSSGDVEQ